MTDEYIKEVYDRLRKRLGHQPSRDEFYKETNVTQYWIVKSSFRTYGALVEEMGDTPKTFFKDDIGEDEFMIPYGNMIKKLGHIPKSSDWIYFDCHPVGSSYMRKYKLVKFNDFAYEFLRYAIDKSEWNEVVKLIPVKNDTKIELPERETEECYVYLMFDAKTKLYKIGISNAPEWREKTLQSEKPSIKNCCKEICQ